MATNLDDKELVSSEELLMAQMIQIDAVAQLLIGFVTVFCKSFLT